MTLYNNRDSCCLGMNVLLSPGHWQNLLYSPSTISIFSLVIIFFIFYLMFYSSVTTVYTLCTFYISDYTTPNTLAGRVGRRFYDTEHANTNPSHNSTHSSYSVQAGRSCIQTRTIVVVKSGHCPIRHQRNPWTRPPPSPGMPKICLGLSDGEMRSCIRTQASSQAQTVPAKPSKSEYG